MVIILDLSYSMLVEDLSPNRLQRAEHKLLDLLKREIRVGTHSIRERRGF